MQERNHLEYCNGKGGVSSIKEDKFRERYQWQLDEGYGQSTHKLIMTVPLQVYFDIGVWCIKNKMSFAGFCKEAVYKDWDKVKSKKYKIPKTVKHTKEQFIQRGLFDE
jgi:hypothetical protein